MLNFRGVHEIGSQQCKQDGVLCMSVMALAWEGNLPPQGITNAETTSGPQ